jgi:hypothetical protein
MDEIWDLWFPSAGATGLSFARTVVDASAAGDRLLVHAAPPELDVEVRAAADGRLPAAGRGLQRQQEGPMSFLVRDGDRITLEDGWPSAEDLGRLVLLPGGEAGVLTDWEHAADRSSWRWSVEFRNSR